jgi:hypothetical protein
MKKLVVFFGMIAYFNAYGVCSPSNMYDAAFLGFSPDESQYALRHTKEVLSLGAADIKDSITNEICYYEVATNKQLSCVKIRTPRDEFKKKDWGVKAPEQDVLDWNMHCRSKTDKKGRCAVDATLDCRGFSEKNPQCVMEISSFIGGLERKNLFKAIHTVTTLNDTLNDLRDSKEASHVYESPGQLGVCYNFKIRHTSANCMSREDVFFCARL